MYDNYSKSQDFLELFPSALLILAQDLTIIECNQAALDFTSESLDKLKKLNFLNLVQSDQKDKFLDFVRKTLNSEKNQSEEFSVKGIGENYFHTLISARNLGRFRDSGSVISLTILDLTLQHMQAVFIKESQSRFENIANSAPVMIWISDIDGLFSFVNNVWCEFTGREKGNELGLSWLQNVHPDQINDLLINYRTALNSRSRFSQEFRLRDKYNNFRWIMMVGTPRYSKDSKFLGLIGTCTDISRQKENEEKIELINRELAEIIATKDKFFSIISHDLRSPLSGLTGILEIIADPAQEIDEDGRREIIEEAYKSSKNIYLLMENLLEWSQLQTGKIKYEPQKLNLLLIVNGVVNLYTQNLRTKGIELELSVNPDIHVMGDKKITETILRNLISNAIKFTPAAGRINVFSRTENEEVIVGVQDSGVGMSGERIKKLFRIDSAQSTKGTNSETGTGLGLILCKELVEKQQGRIWAESELNSGSLFSFTVQKYNLSESKDRLN